MMAIEEDTTDTIVASDLIQSNTLAYSKYVLSNLFPSPIDGMKKVRRRIIYKQPTEESFSGMQLVSNTIAIHPYGDSSIYDTGCSMTNTFESTFPLLHLIGKGGSYSGDTAASARYTKFKLTDFCKDIFFHGVNFKTIPMESTEDLSGREIKYFIPRIPTALLYNNESIGYGYSSRTIPLKFENICDLVIDFVSCFDKYNWNYKRLAKLFIPCLPIKVLIKNEPQLIEAYSHGKFDQPVETEGIFVIQANNSVLFRTLAYGVSPSAIRLNLTNAIRDKNHWLAKNEVIFDALSEDKNYVDFRIMTKRGANIFELIDSIKGILRIRTPMYIINNFVFDEKMVPLDPPGIIAMWYKERYRSILGAKKQRQQELQLIKMRLETQLIVCGHDAEVIAILKVPGATVDEIYLALKTRFGLSTRQCEILVNISLQILMHAKKTELEERLIKIDTEINEINLSFKNIDNEICNEIRGLKKKYKTNSQFISSESKYIGCLIVGDLGIVQVSSINEALDLAKIFHGSKLRFIKYNAHVTNIKFLKLNVQYTHIQSLPATTPATGIMVQYKTDKQLFTRINGKSQCIADSTIITAAYDVLNNVSSKPFVITSNGVIKPAPADLFDNRKHTSDILYAFDPTPNVSEYVVLSVNAAHPNVVRMQPVILGKTKVLFSGAGETVVIGMITKDVDEVLVNLPIFHKHNILHITNIDKYIAKGKVEDVNIRSLDKV